MDKESIDTMTSMTGISILGAVSRAVLSEDRRSIWGFLRALVCAAFVSFLVGNFIEDYKLSNGLHNCVIGISAFLADDILMLTLKLAATAKNNPGATLDWVINFLTGLRNKSANDQQRGDSDKK